MDPLGGDTQPNYDVLRECLCEPIVHRTRGHASNAARRKARSQRKKAQLLSTPPEVADNDAEELAEFVDVLHLHQRCRMPVLKRTS